MTLPLPDSATIPAKPRRTPAWLPLALLLLVVAAGLGIMSLVMRETVPQEARGAAHPAVGRTLTALPLASFADSPARAQPLSFEGHVTLLNFWGPWCMYCRVEFPHLLELQHAAVALPDFRLVSVTCPASPADAPELRAESEAYLREMKADFPLYLDPGGAARAELIRVAGEPEFVFPTTVVIDRDGVIRGYWSGFQPGDAAELRNVVERAAQLSLPIAVR